LVDLVNDSKGRSCHALHGHEIEDRRDSSFASGLAMRIEDLQLFILSV